MAYDVARAKTVRFGDNSETWEYDGVAWTRVFPLSPKASSPVMAYDSKRQKMVLLNDGILYER